MFTFVISLVVIGAALAIAARIVMNGAPQPATDATPRGRERIRRRRSKETPALTPAVAGQAVVAGHGPIEQVRPTPWWVRARAVVLLSALVALLGAFLALLLVLGGALILTGLRNAVQ